MTNPETPPETGIDIGELVRKVFDHKGMKVTAFAERTNMSRQSVYKLFQRKSIETEQLRLISQVLQYDFFRHFQWDTEKAEVTFLEEIIPTPATPVLTEGMLWLQLKEERQRVRQLESRIADKEQIINLLRQNLNKPE